MDNYKRRVLNHFKSSDIKFTEKELQSIEYADFGLDNIEKEGLNLIVYINTERYCAKEMVLLPDQTCPEHSHPNNLYGEGKQETFRCRRGKVYLYVEGEKNSEEILMPTKNKNYYTVEHLIVLEEGEQYTINPNTKHWFKAGDKGAVISEFSSHSDDNSDIFTNPNIKR